MKTERLGMQSRAWYSVTALKLGFPERPALRKTSTTDWKATRNIPGSSRRVAIRSAAKAKHNTLARDSHQKRDCTDDLVIVYRKSIYYRLYYRVID